MFFTHHQSKTLNENAGNVVVHGNDTDIAVILTKNVHHFDNTKLSYDAGLDHNNSREFMYINALTEHVEYPQSLARAYAFVGLDYSPSFFGKGKVCPLEVMRKPEKFIECFELFREEELTSNMIATIEELVCWMYGYKKQTSVNLV